MFIRRGSLLLLLSGRLSQLQGTRHIREAYLSEILRTYREENRPPKREKNLTATDSSKKKSVSQILGGP